MVDYINNRRFYAANSEFLSGSNVFSGYVIRRNNKFTDVHSFPLTAASTFSTDLESSRYFRDRLITDTLVLPHTLSSITVQPNDIITDRLLNDKFNLLNDNITYVYSILQAPNNYLPASTSVQYAALTSNGGVEQLPFYSAVRTTTEWLSSIDYTGFENINTGIGMTSLYDTSAFALFCTTSASFIALTGNNNGVNRVEESLYVSQSGSDYKFSNITSTDLDGTYLYVCDKGNNFIAKYDIHSYITDDTNFRNRRILIESLGSIGGEDDDSILNAPSLVAVKRDRVAVFDSGNNVIKIFDQNFNFQRKFGVGQLYREPAVAIQYDRFSNELYVITEATAGDLKLYKVQEDFTIVGPIVLDETLEDGEYVKKIVFSSNNSNFWYLVTTGNIYKKLVNRPKKTIGAYSADKLLVFFTYKWNYADFTYNTATLVWNISDNRTSSFGNFIGLSLDPSQDNFDKAYMFKYGRFYRYEEPNDYINLLNFSNNSNYSIDSISLSNKEFVQPPVYNKEIYKIISNLLNVKNSIIGNYYGSYDVSGTYRLKGYNYLIDLSNFVVENIKDFIVHQNEGVNYYSINRTLRNVYDLQKSLIEAVTIEVEGLIPYPLTADTLIVE
jgi:hypothetical protein